MWTLQLHVLTDYRMRQLKVFYMDAELSVVGSTSDSGGIGLGKAKIT